MEEVNPAIEILIPMTDALMGSLAYPISNIDVELDSSTVNRIQEVAKLPKKDKKQVFLVIDAFRRF